MSTTDTSTITLEPFVEARIMYLDGRKRPSLCIVEGNQYCASFSPIASFTSELAAQAFVRLLNDGHKLVSEIKPCPKN